MPETSPLPAGFDPDTVPSTVVMHRDGFRALVFHPLGLDHENAQAAIARLRRRGVHVVNAPEPAEAA